MAEPANAVRERKWRKPALWLGLLTAAAIVGTVGWQFWLRHVHKRDAFYTSSCANHFIQLSMGLRVVAHEKPGLMLPREADTKIALHALGTEYFGSLDDYGSACPESYLHNESIGYLYVGDGLRLGDVQEQGILILFCPAENHQRSSDHGHAFADRMGMMCPTNQKMVELLGDAVRRGESGEVAYSERAMKILRSELEKRRKPAK